MRLQSVVVALLITAASALANEPQDDPRKQLEFFVGSWTIAGEDGYRETCRWAPGQRAVICETANGFSILSYSAAERAYTHYSLTRHGVLETLYGWITGTTWNFTGQTEKPGEHKRVKVTLTPTSRGFSFRQDASINAGAWTKEHDFEYVRLSAAAAQTEQTK